MMLLRKKKKINDALLDIVCFVKDSEFTKRVQITKITILKYWESIVQFWLCTLNRPFTLSIHIGLYVAKPSQRKP